MLSRTQIESLARRFGVGLAVQERDYVQYIFLYLLNRESNAFIFKGGTCLKIIYNSPRYSDDLDFNCDLDKDSINRTIDKCAKDLSTFGVDSVLKNTRFLKDGFTSDLSFRGVRFNGREMTKNKIRIDISTRGEKLIIQNKILNIEDTYPDIPRFTVSCASLADILAEKIMALVIRGKPRDLWDTWFFLEKGERLDIKLINDKLKLDNVEFNKEDLKDRLEGIKVNWKRDLSNLLAPGQFPDFEKVKDEIYTKFDILGNNTSL